MKKNIVTITILFVCSCMQSLYSNTLQGKVIYVNKIDLRHVDSIDEDKKIELQHSMTRSIRTKLESMGFITVSLDDFKNDDALKYNEAVLSVEKAVQKIKTQKADHEIFIFLHSNPLNKNIITNVQLKDVASSELVREPQINKNAEDIHQANRVMLSLIDLMFHGEYYEKIDVKKKVIFKTQPKGANVIVDGKLLSTNKTHSLNVGAHRVVFELEDHADIVEIVDVMPDDPEPIVILRKFDKPKAYLVWKAIPEDADVFVNGTKIEVAVGKYLVDANTDVNITINKDKYKEWKTTLKLKPWEESEIDVQELEPIKGTIIFKSIEGATVFVDDQEMGTIKDEDKGLEVKDLEVNTNLNIAVRKSKYKTQLDEIKLMPAETIVKEYDLIYVKYEEEYLEKLARAKYLKRWGYATTATSLGLFTLGTLYFLKYKSAKSKYDSSIDPVEISNLRHKASTNKKITYVAFGLGLGAAITSIMLFYNSSTPSPPEEISSSYDVAPKEDGFMFQYTYRF